MDKHQFDVWSTNYDETVKKSTEGYPFEGYEKAIQAIYCLIQNDSNTKILDLGIGTGTLTQKLYLEGARITGVDFSEKMLNQAKQKMPDATLIECDLNDGVPFVLQNMKFQYIVSAYAFHHWEDRQKIDLIKQCTDLLTPNGKILIADIMFSTLFDRESCKKQYRNCWDDEEFYILADEFIRTLRSIGLVIKFHPISFCCGILEISVR